jgi:hypothetical protein
VDLDKALRRERVGLYAFTMQGLYATGVAAVALGIARAMLSELITLASRKAPRGLARLADNAVVQADVARAEARVGSAHLIDTLQWRRRRGADRHQSGPRATRLRQRDPGRGRAGRRRKGAGVDAIFPGSPFEQRFRDMHTLYQQIQAHTDHFAVRAKSHTRSKSNGA